MSHSNDDGKTDFNCPCGRRLRVSIREKPTEVQCCHCGRTFHFQNGICLGGDCAREDEQAQRCPSSHRDDFVDVDVAVTPAAPATPPSEDVISSLNSASGPRDSNRQATPVTTQTQSPTGPEEQHEHWSLASYLATVGLVNDDTRIAAVLSIGLIVAGLFGLYAAAISSASTFWDIDAFWNAFYYTDYEAFRLDAPVLWRVVLFSGVFTLAVARCLVSMQTGKPRISDIFWIALAALSVRLQSRDLAFVWMLSPLGLGLAIFVGIVLLTCGTATVMRRRRDIRKVHVLCDAITITVEVISVIAVLCIPQTSGFQGSPAPVIPESQYLLGFLVLMAFSVIGARLACLMRRIRIQDENQRRYIGWIVAIIGGLILTVVSLIPVDPVFIYNNRKTVGLMMLSREAVWHINHPDEKPTTEFETLSHLCYGMETLDHGNSEPNDVLSMAYVGLNQSLGRMEPFEAMKAVSTNTWLSPESQVAMILEIKDPCDYDEGQFEMLYDLWLEATLREDQPSSELVALEERMTEVFSRLNRSLARTKPLDAMKEVANAESWLSSQCRLALILEPEDPGGDDEELYEIFHEVWEAVSAHEETSSQPMERLAANMTRAFSTVVNSRSKIDLVETLQAVAQAEAWLSEEDRLELSLVPLRLVPEWLLAQMDDTSLWDVKNAWSEAQKARIAVAESLDEEGRSSFVLHDAVLLEFAEEWATWAVTEAATRSTEDENDMQIRQKLEIAKDLLLSLRATSQVDLDSNDQLVEDIIADLNVPSTEWNNLSRLCLAEKVARGCDGESWDDVGERLDAMDKKLNCRFTDLHCLRAEREKMACLCEHLMVDDSSSRAMVRAAGWFWSELEPQLKTEFPQLSVMYAWGFWRRAQESLLLNRPIALAVTQETLFVAYPDPNNLEARIQKRKQRSLDLGSVSFAEE